METGTYGVEAAVAVGSSSSESFVRRECCSLRGGEAKQGLGRGECEEGLARRVMNGEVERRESLTPSKLQE